MSGNRFSKGSNPLTTSFSSAIALGQSAPSGQATPVPLSSIRTNPEQPRRYFDDAALQELAASIREHGVMQPILLRPLEDGQYEIVYGERRYRASILAGRDTVPALIRPVLPEEARVLAAMENLQREDLSPFEEAWYKLQLVSQALEMPAEEVRAYLPTLQRRVSKHKDIEFPEHLEKLQQLFASLGGSWQTFAVHGLRILNLPETLQSVLQTGQLEYSKALAISSAPVEHHESLIRLAIDEELTREALQERVAALNQTPVKVEPPVARARTLLGPKHYRSLSPDRQRQADKLAAQIIALYDEENLN